MKRLITKLTAVATLLALGAFSIIVYAISLYITRALPFADMKRYLTRKGRAQHHDTSSANIDPGAGA